MKTIRRKQQGVAILIMLTVLVLALTTVLVTQLSTNQLRTARGVDNARVLDEAAQALQGYALRQTIPGVLPCPDNTGDGQANAAGTACASQLGLLPYRDLDLDALTDSSGASLWYAVTTNHVSGAAAQKNSSLAPGLTLDGNAMVAVVIAPGAALDGQNRAPLTRTDFLEGINADADFTDYSNTPSAAQNDQVLGLTAGSIWPMVELLATRTAAQLMATYRTNCGDYPWASAFGGAANSISNQRAGGIPLGTALPFDWGAVCGLNTAPAVNTWLANHWQNQIYYRMCTTAEGNCLTVAGHGTSPANGVVVAPGVITGSQTRASTNISDYYEDLNSDANDAGFRYELPSAYTTTFNDTVRPIGP